MVGDTVGDPYKDTCSVALNPIIKFTTLFGLLAVEIAVKAPPATAHLIGAVLFVVGLGFVLRSFYGMRITNVAIVKVGAAAGGIAPQAKRQVG